MKDNDILPSAKYGNTNGNSTASSPCQLVWDIADEFYRQAQLDDAKPFERKRVLAFCLERGVTFYTARAQYQAWRKARGL